MFISAYFLDKNEAETVFSKIDCFISVKNMDS